MAIGDNIKRRRLELRLSQQELADMMGYKSRSSIAKIESGENDVSQKKLKKFAIVLETTLSDLISFELDNNQSSVNNKYDFKPRKHKNIAIVLAGGDSGGNIPCQFLMVKDKPIINYCLDIYQSHPLIDEIYVVCLKGWEKIVGNYAEQYKITKLKEIFPAGNSGIRSFKNAFDYIKDECYNDDVIIIQEATRPRINADILSKLLQSCFETGSTILCHRMKDYVQFDVSGENSKYINREDIVALQSPEAHRFSLLKEIFDVAEKDKHELLESCCTMLLYNLGYKINFLENNINNVKISNEEDAASFATFVRSK